MECQRVNIGRHFLIFWPRFLELNIPWIRVLEMRYPPLWRRAKESLSVGSPGERRREFRSQRQWSREEQLDVGTILLVVSMLRPHWSTVAVCEY